MTDDIPACQRAEGDPVDFFQDARRDIQPGYGPSRNILLRHVAGHDDLRSVADPRQKHLHLSRRRVLRLIEDDVGVVQRASAHICQRRNLDQSLLHVPLKRLGAHNLIQRVVQRPQIRVDLALEVAGEKSELLARLNRGPCQDDSSDFIRTEAFRGATEDELYDTWNCVLTLLVYCGNVDIKMGDMRTDDFIDCFGWCSRNIADFALTYETAEQMLTVWSRLLHFLKMRHAITDDSFADKCRSLVLDEENKRLLLVDDEGNFRYDLLKHHQQIDTDLNAKVYLDMDNYLDDVLYDMRRYFSTSEYKEDRDNATALGFGLSENMREYDQVRGTRDEEAFWEYFLFDYHLLATGKTPIRTYVDTYQPDPKESVGRLKAVRDILDSLLTARFVLLTEVRRDKEAGGWYYCKDLLSGGILYLSLPIDDDFDTTDVLFVGHAMDNGNMVFTYLRGLKTTASAELRIKYVCSHLQQWYAIQKPEAAD